MVALTSTTIIKVKGARVSLGLATRIFFVEKGVEEIGKKREWKRRKWKEKERKTAAS